MRELKTYFTIRDRTKRSGIEYSQLSSNEKAYLYRRTDLDTNSTSYLSFLRMEDKILGAVIFPGSGDFGFWAFRFIKIEEAQSKFAELSNLGII